MAKAYHDWVLVHPHPPVKLSLRSNFSYIRCSHLQRFGD